MNDLHFETCLICGSQCPKGLPHGPHCGPHCIPSNFTVQTPMSDLMHDLTPYNIIKPVKYAGAYNICKEIEDSTNYHIALKHKPNVVHRFFAKLLLGWVWIDYE